MHTRRRAVLWSLILGVLTAVMLSIGSAPTVHQEVSRPTPATYYDL